MIHRNGFTAVELMVTLFVGSLFLISGYQLYGVVNMRSSNVREMSEASNIGYSVLRNQGSVLVGSPSSCTATPAFGPVSPLPATTLTNLEVALYQCRPFSDLSNVVQVTVRVRYGNSTPKKEVIHATYISQ